MKKKQKGSSLKVKYEDGTIQDLEFYSVNDGPKEFLGDKTGLTYGEGDYYAQTIGSLYAWMAGHGASDELSGTVIQAASLVIAQGLSEDLGGCVAFNNEKADPLVYVPDDTQPFVINTFEVVMKLLFSQDWNYEDKIQYVTPIGKRVSLEELNMQLNDAIEVENYELAAKLRDRIKRKMK